jgi:hypothetical protein
MDLEVEEDVASDVDLEAEDDITSAVEHVLEESSNEVESKNPDGTLTQNEARNIDRRVRELVDVSNLTCFGARTNQADFHPAPIFDTWTTNAESIHDLSLLVPPTEFDAFLRERAIPMAISALGDANTPDKYWRDVVTSFETSQHAEVTRTAAETQQQQHANGTRLVTPVETSRACRYTFVQGVGLRPSKFPLDVQNFHDVLGDEGRLSFASVARRYNQVGIRDVDFDEDGANAIDDDADLAPDPGTEKQPIADVSCFQLACNGEPFELYTVPAQLTQDYPLGLTHFGQQIIKYARGRSRDELVGSVNDFLSVLLRRIKPGRHKLGLYLRPRLPWATFGEMFQRVTNEMLAEVDREPQITECLIRLFSRCLESRIDHVDSFPLHADTPKKGDLLDVWRTAFEDHTIRGSSLAEVWWSFLAAYNQREMATNFSDYVYNVLNAMWTPTTVRAVNDLLAKQHKTFPKDAVSTALFESGDPWLEECKQRLQKYEKLTDDIDKYVKQDCKKNDHVWGQKDKENQETLGEMIDDIRDAFSSVCDHFYDHPWVSVADDDSANTQANPRIDEWSRTFRLGMLDISEAHTARLLFDNTRFYTSRLKRSEWETWIVRDFVQSIIRDEDVGFCLWGSTSDRWEAHPTVQDNLFTSYSKTQSVHPEAAAQYITDSAGNTRAVPTSIVNSQKDLAQALMRHELGLDKKQQKWWHETKKTSVLVEAGSPMPDLLASTRYPITQAFRPGNEVKLTGCSHTLELEYWRIAYRPGKTDRIPVGPTHANPNPDEKQDESAMDTDDNTKPQGGKAEAHLTALTVTSHLFSNETKTTQPSPVPYDWPLLGVAAPVNYYQEIPVSFSGSGRDLMLFIVPTNSTVPVFAWASKNREYDPVWQEGLMSAAEAPAKQEAAPLVADEIVVPMPRDVMEARKPGKLTRELAALGLQQVHMPRMDITENKEQDRAQTNLSMGQGQSSSSSRVPLVPLTDLKPRLKKDQTPLPFSLSYVLSVGKPTEAAADLALYKRKLMNVATSSLVISNLPFGEDIQLFLGIQTDAYLLHEYSCAINGECSPGLEFFYHDEEGRSASDVVASCQLLFATEQTIRRTCPRARIAIQGSAQFDVVLPLDESFLQGHPAPNVVSRQSPCDMTYEYHLRDNEQLRAYSRQMADSLASFTYVLHVDFENEQVTRYDCATGKALDFAHFTNNAAYHN